MNRSLLIKLSLMKGIGWKTISALVPYVNTEEELLTTNLESIASRTGLKIELLNKIKDKMINNEYEELLLKWQKDGIGVVTYFDEEYPILLKEIAQPPWTIFYLGNIDLLSNPYSLAIVGTRNPTNYGRMVTVKIAQELSQHGWTVISGLARGIDAEAHKGALGGVGKTIAVLGGGINNIYPPENEKLYKRIIEENGLIISEFPPDILPKPGLFPIRNRVISGLSLGTLVVEASWKSGSLITADYANEQSREVFAIPGMITSLQSQGTNQLIKQGAKLVTTVDDIFEEFTHIYEYMKKEKNEDDILSNLSDSEKYIVSLINYTPINIEDLLQQSKLPNSETYRLLLILQNKNIIKQLPGSIFVRKIN